MVKKWLSISLCWTFIMTLLSVHGITTKLKNITRLDMNDSSTVHLYVVTKNITLEDNGILVANLTSRVYCWSYNETIHIDGKYNGTIYNDTITIDDDTDFDDSHCGIPGPTLVMHPGQHATLVYHNLLYGVGKDEETQNYYNCSKAKLKHLTKTTYNNPDVINLHVHGLHVSPHQDNIVEIQINPRCPKAFKDNEAWVNSIGKNCSTDTSGDSHTYKYEIPSDHYPGSHWYHAHGHGSTTIHVGGGIYGAINMMPADDLLQYEPNISNSNDHDLLVSYIWYHDNSICQDYVLKDIKTYCKNSFADSITIPVPNITTPLKHSRGFSPLDFPVQSFCIVSCHIKKDYPNQYDNSGTPYNIKLNPEYDPYYVETFIVNGQVSPTLFISTGEWHRLRIVNTNMNYLLWTATNYAGNNVNQTDLQQWLIASDGIYFENGPRAVWQPPYNGTVVIPPGGRADILVYALEANQYNVYPSNDTRNTTFKRAPLPIFEQDILYISATGDTKTREQSYSTCEDWSNGGYGDKLKCTPQSYHHSAYLTNTLNLNASNSDLTAGCTSPHNPDDMSQCNLVLERLVTPDCQVAMNGFEYSTTTALLNISAGVTREWVITSNFHPFHHHTWPFQVQRDVTGGWLAQRGDWRDTLGAAGSYVARSNYFNFTNGKLVTHCHFVPHEDHGMMSYHNLVPPESLKDKKIYPKKQSSDSYFTEPGLSSCNEINTPMIGITYIDSIDVDTKIAIILRVFKLNNLCYLGVLMINQFRAGGVDNVWLGFGIGGDYTKNYKDISMTGHALVWSLQANSDNGISLHNVNIEEITLNSTFRFDPLNKTSMVCQSNTSSYATTESDTVYFYYCVRPITDKIESLLSNTTNVGFIWAYGEGRFQKGRMHSARSSCKFKFFPTDDTFNSFDDIINVSYTYCLHEQNQIDVSIGNQNNALQKSIHISNFGIGKQDFLDNSGYCAKANVTCPDSDHQSINELIIILSSVTGAILIFGVIIVVYVRCFRVASKEETTDINNEVEIDQVIRSASPGSPGSLKSSESLDIEKEVVFVKEDETESI